MKKEFIMIDLTTGGHAIIRISDIKDVFDYFVDGEFTQCDIYCTSGEGFRLFHTTIHAQEIYAMIMTETT